MGAAVDRFDPQRPGFVTLRFDDHVIGFGHPHAEFIDRHRLDLPAIGGDDGHADPRDAHIHDAHRGAVDQPQPDFFTRFRQQPRLFRRRLAVDHQAIARDIGDVGRVHAHRCPLRPVLERFAETELAGILQQLRQGALVEIIIVRITLDVAQDAFGVLAGEFGNQHDMAAVGGDRVGRPGRDDHRAILAGLFLRRRMGVVPIGAVLADRECVGEGLAGLDAGKGVETRGTILGRRHQQAVPVDRGGFRQPVGHPHRFGFALGEVQHRAGHTAVDGDDIGQPPGFDRQFQSLDDKIMRRRLRRKRREQGQERKEAHHGAPDGPPGIQAQAGSLSRPPRGVFSGVFSGGGRCARHRVAGQSPDSGRYRTRSWQSHCRRAACR